MALTPEIAQVQINPTHPFATAMQVLVDARAEQIAMLDSIADKHAPVLAEAVRARGEIARQQQIVDDLAAALEALEVSADAKEAGFATTSTSRPSFMRPGV